MDILFELDFFVEFVDHVTRISTFAFLGNVLVEELLVDQIVVLGLGLVELLLLLLFGVEFMEVIL